jgi:hypothetical protein
VLHFKIERGGFKLILVIDILDNKSEHKNKNGKNIIYIYVSFFFIINGLVSKSFLPIAYL